LSSFAKCIASLYPGLFFQLTMGLMGLSSLCSFMVPCMRGVVGFMFVFFHFSACFIVILHSLMAAFIAFCCLLVWFFGTLVKLFCVIKSSIFWWYSFCSIITRVLPLSALVTVKLCSLIFFFLPFYWCLFRFVVCSYYSIPSCVRLIGRESMLYIYMLYHSYSIKNI
jgi:hypothetical protein